VKNINQKTRLFILRSRKRLVNAACRRLYRENNHDISNTFVLAGVARSGTTWLSDLIKSQIPCRIMWEPFNPHKMKAYRHFPDFIYKQSEEIDLDLFEYSNKVLHGNIRGAWIDREIDRCRFDYRLVKDVRINLFLHWMHNHFPDVPIIFMIRHPCAVVLSRMEAKWETDDDIHSFLSQNKLVEDYLTDKADFIKTAGTIEEKHAIIWAIQNLIPLNQFKNSALNIIFYEDLCVSPENEITKIFNIIGKNFHKDIFQGLDKPSRTTQSSSAIISGVDKVSRWRDVLSPRQIRSVLSVVATFGLDCLYEDSLTPVIRSYEKIIQQIS
jgi:hypothetical protein